MRCWRVAVQHANSTHTPQNRHLNGQKPRTPYATFVRIVTPTAPEDGRVSPKHVELKELKANKYSIYQVGNLFHNNNNNYK